MPPACAEPAPEPWPPAPWPHVSLPRAASPRPQGPTYPSVGSNPGSFAAPLPSLPDILPPRGLILLLDAASPLLPLSASPPGSPSSPSASTSLPCPSLVLEWPGGDLAEAASYFIDLHPSAGWAGSWLRFQEQVWQLQATLSVLAGAGRELRDKDKNLPGGLRAENITGTVAGNAASSRKPSARRVLWPTRVPTPSLHVQTPSSPLP